MAQTSEDFALPLIQSSSQVEARFSMVRISKSVNPPVLILGKGMTALDALRALAEKG